MNLVIVILGPTKTGKTDLAFKLAKELNSQVISADSRQVYKYLDIGTDKISKEKRKIVFHHFIDIISPFENYSAGRYQKEVYNVLDNLIKRGKIPVIAGGTLFYIKNIVEGVILPPYNKEIREKLHLKYKGNYIEAYRDLESIDIEVAKRINKKDIFRILRALEVKLSTNKSILYWKDKRLDLSNKYKFLIYGLNYQNRQVLYEKIYKRAKWQVENGLIDEVKNILSLSVLKGITLSTIKDLKSLNTLGYKETIAYLEGRIKSLNNLIDEISKNTCHFAKRQIIFSRKYFPESKVKWFFRDKYSIDDILSKILSELKKNI